MSLEDIEKEIRSAFDAGIDASMPQAVMSSWLPKLTSAPTAILAIGKAAGPMAEACRDFGLDAKGLLITHDHSVHVYDFESFVGGHPVPDEGSLKGAQAALDFVKALGEDDHLLVLVSGGGSALMTLPQAGLSLDDKMKINDILLKSGMDIHQMNSIRRLLSQVKGGRLARAAFPAKVTQWAMSDVPATGDLARDLTAIASGPFAPDPVPLDETLCLIKKAGLNQHEAVSQYLLALEDAPGRGPVRVDNTAFAHVNTNIIASNAIAREASALRLDADLTILPELAGDAAEMGARLAEFAMIASRPIAAVTGGETVVTLGEEHGSGGRSQELALAFLVAMSGYQARGHDIPNFVLLAGGTDGRDGPTDAAGALVSHKMIAEGALLEHFRDALKRHDSNPALEKLNALIKIPPTGTNLGDLVLLKTW